MDGKRVLCGDQMKMPMAHQGRHGCEPEIGSRSTREGRTGSPLHRISTPSPLVIRPRLVD
jgi:hypothetical protein